MFTHNGKEIPLAPTIQDPDNEDTWGGDWTDFLLEGETIHSSIWIIPDDLISVSESATITHTKILMKGGISGNSYTVTNRIKTTEDTSIDRSMVIRCYNT